ncbi:MAG: PrsW family intramembrane metalloprotease [Anaerolineales bacterium]|nr:PrsW family intramembrane metalloprotease [Anaerolineales bacterium]
MALILSLCIGFGASFLFAYILYWLDRYEKEPLPLLGGVFLWGAIVAAGSAFLINTALGLGIYIFTGSETATEFATTSLVAPFVEEILKGLAVLLVFAIFRREFDSVLDGIIYAGIAALGFAATENAYYIYTYGYQEGGFSGLLWLTFIRIILVGWQHPFYTAFFGIGLAIGRLNRNVLVKIGAPLLGLGAAMFTHAVHNTLAGMMQGLGGLFLGTTIDWTGWFFMFLVVLWAIHHEGQLIRRYLTTEVEAGTMSLAHYHTAASTWRQMAARFSALFHGRYKSTSRFYQLCGEYAHKRQQYARLGDESGNVAILRQLRDEMAKLAPFAQVA